MIQYTGLGFEVECDKCSDILYVDEADNSHEGFLYAVGYMKSEGWRIFKHEGEWCHSCPDCIKQQ